MGSMDSGFHSKGEADTASFMLWVTVLFICKGETPAKWHGARFLAEENLIVVLAKF